MGCLFAKSYVLHLAFVYMEKESWKAGQLGLVYLKALSAFVSQMLNIQHVFPMSFGFANRYLNRLFEMLWFISPEKTLMGENNFKVLFLSIIISIF